MLFRNLYIFLLLFIIAYCIVQTCKNLEIYTFNSNNKGPNILFLGGIHGNEESDLGLNRLVTLLEKNRLFLIRGL